MPLTSALRRRPKIDLRAAAPMPRRSNRAFLYGRRGLGRAEGGVSLPSDDAPEAVRAGPAIRLARPASRSPGPRQDPIVIAGTARNGDSLTVRLVPGAGGGTDGRVVVGPGD